MKGSCSRHIVETKVLWRCIPASCRVWNFTVHRELHTVFALSAVIALHGEGGSQWVQPLQIRAASLKIFSQHFRIYRSICSHWISLQHGDVMTSLR